MIFFSVSSEVLGEFIQVLGHYVFTKVRRLVERDYLVCASC